MQIAADAEDRLVCAVLAAQVAALRDHIEGHAAVELLWQVADVLSLLSGLVGELVGNAALGDPSLDPALVGRCATAVAAQVEVGSAVETLALLQAQRHDLARQMADCVVTGLQSLAAEDGGLSARDLSALYVSEDQRRVHESAARQFSTAARQP